MPTALLHEPDLLTLEQRLRDRDNTLDFEAAIHALIATVRDLTKRGDALHTELNGSRAALDRCETLNAGHQQELTRYRAIVTILRERMKIDEASHRLAMASLDAFDAGAIIIEAAH